MSKRRGKKKKKQQQAPAAEAEETAAAEETGDEAPPPAAETPETPEAAAGDEAAVPVGVLREVEAQRDEYLALAQRKTADLENYRKRVARERESERLRIQADVIRELLNPLDDLDRALSAARQEENFATLVEGVKMVREAFWKGLQSVDLEIIPAEPGTPFDPNVHEGMAQVPHPEVAAGCIIEEISRGYRMGERVVRASKVVVSAGPPASEAPGGEESEEE